MRLLAFLLCLISLPTFAAGSSGASNPGMVPVGTFVLDDCLESAGGIGIKDAGSVCGSGGGGVTWPTTNDIVISNSTSSPTGLAPVNGDCVVGAGGAWTAGSCGSGGGSPGGTTNSIQYNAGSSTFGGITIGTAQLLFGQANAGLPAAETINGDLTFTALGTATLATVNTNTGSFGSSTAIPNFTVNGKGLITAAGTNIVIAPAGTLSGTTLNSSVVTSSLTTVGTIGSGTWQGTAIANTYLANDATTVNGQTCTLGGSCTVTAASSGIQIGTTTVSPSAAGSVLSNNSGVVGQYGITGSAGSVMLSQSPTTSGTLTAAAANFSGSVGIGTTAPSYALTVNGDIGIPYGNTIHAYGFTYNNVITTNFDSGNGKDYTQISVPGSGASDANPVITIWSAPKVGIGTNQPYSVLETEFSGNYTNTETAGNGIQTATGHSTSDYTLYMGADKTHDLSYIQSVNWGTTIANLSLNARGGDVGVGTATPAGNLDVENGSNTAELCLNSSCVTNLSGGGGGSPGGSDTNVQYNSSGSFSGNSGFTYNGGIVYIASQLGVGTSAPVNTIDLLGATDIGFSGVSASPNELIVNGPVTIGTSVQAAGSPELTIRNGGISVTFGGLSTLDGDIDVTNGNINATTGYVNSNLGYEINSANAVSFPADSTAGASVAVGPSALAGQSVSGTQNTAVGYQSLSYGNAVNSTAVGYQSSQNISDTDDVAIGYQAGMGNSGSSNNANNVFVGAGAGANIMSNASGNTVIGAQAANFLSSGAQNVVIGQDVGPANLTTSLFNVLIGPYGPNCDVSTSGANFEIHLCGEGGDAIKVLGTNSPSTEDIGLTGLVGINSSTPAGTLDVENGSNTANICLNGSCVTSLSGGGGGGTVTSFSAGNLSPIFTTSVATATTTPALSFSLSNAAAGTVLGNNTSSSASPSYTSSPYIATELSIGTASPLSTNMLQIGTNSPAQLSIGTEVGGKGGVMIGTTTDEGYKTLNTGGTIYQNGVPVLTTAVTSIATTTPISGGTITTTGTISCPTCIASASTWTQGDIIYYNGSNWVDLPAGTSGNFLKTQGASANPTWASVTASAAGSSTQVQYNSSGSLAASSNFIYSGGDLGLNVASPSAVIDVSQSGQTGFNLAGRLWNTSTDSTSTGAATTSGNTSYRPLGNQGAQVLATGTTTGQNVGGTYLVGGAATNIAAWASSTSAINSATNIGLAAFALNTGTSPTQVAGYFALKDYGSSLPTFSSAALIADNGSQSSPIFLGRVNGTTDFEIFSDGGVGIGTSQDKGVGTINLSGDCYINGVAGCGSGGSGTVTSVATTSPITGGTFTTSGTIACNTCVTSAAALTSGDIVIGQGLQASAVDASASLSTGALTLGASGTAGSVKMGNATSGTVTIQPVTGALGTVTASLPANTGTIGELNLAQTWSAVQTFNANDLSAGNVIVTSSTIPTNGDYLPAANTYGISTNSTNRLNINSTGQVGIGTAVMTYFVDVYSTNGLPVRYSDNSTLNAGVAYNSVQGKNVNIEFQNAGVNEFYFQNVGATNTWDILNSDANSNKILISATQAGAIAMPQLATSSSAATGTMCWTTSTGNITVDTTTTCLLSSRRFKKNIKPMEAALEKIMQMKPITFNYRDPKMGADKLSGLIAEDVLPIDKTLVELDPQGKAYKIRYEGLTALNTKAIQEQQKEIEQLKPNAVAFHRCVSWLPLLCDGQ